MRPHRLAYRAAVGALALALSACSSGGSPGIVPSGNAANNGGGSSAPQSSSVQVAFTMHWNSGASSSASKRAPNYVPSTARSVAVSVNGGVAQVLNSPSTTLSIAAPAGVDTFAFTVYDEQNGQGNTLSQAVVTQTVVIDTANVVSATLNGVIASLSVALSNPKPNAGAPATVNVNVSALDADGNVIVGPGDYNTPIKLSVNDPANSGAVSLSSTLIQTPGGAVTLTYNGATLSSAAIIAAATGVPTASTAFAPTPTFYQFSIPVASNRPNFIAAGSDGNMWFTESPGGKVARITPAGVVTEFTVPTANAQPQAIIGATDGNLWFTEFSLNSNPSLGTAKLAKLTTTGTFTEYSTLFAPPPNDQPLGLVDRGDGNIWYVGNGSSRVGYQGISNGMAGETSVPTANAQPFGIAAAGDGNMYYTEQNTDKIGRIGNLAAAQSEISLTTDSGPSSIVRGPDGNLWFTENFSNKIGRLNPTSFAVTGEFATLTANSSPFSICVGQDGALWFTETGQDKIGRITTGGTITEYASPLTGLGLRGIATAPDGSLWFAETGAGVNPGRIGKLVY